MLNRVSCFKVAAILFVLIKVCQTETIAAEEGAKLEVYGFAQADYIQDFRRVDPAWEDTLRPTRIPTTPGQFGSNGQAILSARQSQFGVQGSYPIQNKSLKAKFEFDMFGVGADEGKTTIRLRHAYGQWGAWLAGQTHSLFMDADLFPNVIDYWGPAGMAFYRLPQIRWNPVDTATSYFAIAIERPGNEIDPGQIREVDPSLGTNIRADEKVPDLTAQGRMIGDWGHVQLAAMVRRIGFETLSAPNNSPKGFTVGWGTDLSTVLKVADTYKLYLSGLYGRGIATYMNDGGVDLAPEGTVQNLSPKAVPLFGVMAYLEHAWTDSWTSSIGYSRTQVENTSFQAGSAFHSGEYASANLLYSPDKKFLVGGEFLWGRRTDFSGATGNDLRTQISFRYRFSSNI
jgi:hypothetical protein